MFSGSCIAPPHRITASPGWPPARQGRRQAKNSPSAQTRRCDPMRGGLLRLLAAHIWCGRHRCDETPSGQRRKLIRTSLRAMAHVSSGTFKGVCCSSSPIHSEARPCALRRPVSSAEAQTGLKGPGARPNDRHPREVPPSLLRGVDIRCGSPGAGAKLSDPPR